MIDWARIAELRDEVGPEDFAEIAGLFLSEIAPMISEISAASDVAALRDGYHGLKGSALNLGFTRVAELCAQAETAPEAADLDAVAAACRTAEAELRARHPEIAA